MDNALTPGLKPMPKAIIFDLDDTLLVEEDSARDCLIQACGIARDRYGADPLELHDTLRQICREIWFKSPAREFCMRVGISSWEGLWATYEGGNKNLETLKELGASVPPGFLARRPDGSRYQRPLPGRPTG